jgi:hypothetical protein
MLHVCTARIQFFFVCCVALTLILSTRSGSTLQKWKAFTAQTETMTKALKKKDTAGALKAYQDATVTLDDYLSLVALPPSKEIVSS